MKKKYNIKLQKYYHSRIVKLSEHLKKNIPKSEQWFHQLYKDNKDFFDVFNERFLCYIPDIINKLYKYIIEIDDKNHNKPYEKYRDRIKTQRYRNVGYVVFRVKAYDLESAKNVIQQVVSYRNSLLYTEVWFDIHFFKGNKLKLKNKI